MDDRREEVTTSTVLMESSGRKRVMDFTGAGWRSFRASFSRSLHDLVFNKVLVCGLALAWHVLEGQHDDMIRWQGGGRRVRVEVTPERHYMADRPRILMVGLTKAGWQLVNAMGLAVPATPVEAASGSEMKE